MYLYVCILESGKIIELEKNVGEMEVAFMMRKYVGIDAGKYVDLMVGSCGILFLFAGRSLSFFFEISFDHLSISEIGIKVISLL